jgi:hypothetical protein
MLSYPRDREFLIENHFFPDNGEMQRSMTPGRVLCSTASEKFDLVVMPKSLYFYVSGQKSDLIYCEYTKSHISSFHGTAHFRCVYKQAVLFCSWIDT